MKYLEFTKNNTKMEREGKIKVIRTPGGRKRRKKPVIKSKFVRIKTTLIKSEGLKIRITVRPREKYLKRD